MTTTITRIAAGLLVAAGLAVGSAGMAPLAVAETGSNSSRGESDSRSDRADQRRGSVGLNGNRPQSQQFPKTLDQFKHLPFDPAQPGGD